MKLMQLGIRKRVVIGAVAAVAASAVAITVAVSSPTSGGVQALTPQHSVGSALTATFQSPISSSDSRRSVGEKLTEYAAKTEAVSSAKTRSLIAKAGINAETATQSGKTLDLDHAFTRETENGSYILRIPFTAESNLLDISGYTVMFNPDKSIASRGEVVYEQRTADSGRVALWQDGKLMTDQVVSDGTTADTANANVQRTFNWDRLNKCLLNAGIAQWALIAIGIACGLLCGATLGIGCVACVVAAGGVLGTTAGTCVARAMVS